MQKSTIEWTDQVWNPVSGCTKVSQGCKNCYAETMFTRFGKHWGQEFTDVTLHEGRLSDPLSISKPSRIFVNSMSDLFHEKVPFEFIRSVFLTMIMCPEHTFQILTKRIDRANEYYAWMRERYPNLKPLKNILIGVSCEDQETATERIPKLQQLPGRKFLSFEPLLGPIWLAPLMHEGIEWIITGGESGAKARPMHPDWVRSLRDQCNELRIPFFFKQWGAYNQIDFDVDSLRVCLKNKSLFNYTDKSGRKFHLLDLDGDRLVHYGPICSQQDKDDIKNNWIALQKVGKIKSGNVLDGKQHLNFPM